MKIAILVTACLTTSLAYVNYDTYQNDYTTVGNIFQTVDELDGVDLLFEENSRVPKWLNGDYYSISRKF